MLKGLLKLIVFGCIGLTVLGAIVAKLNPDKAPNIVATRTPEAIEVVVPTPAPVWTQAPVLTKTPNPPEYNLAIINAGGYISPKDITVVRFRYLILEIVRKTGDDPIEIADWTVKVHSVLREKYGKDVKLLELMEEANIAIPDDKKKRFKYKDIIEMLGVTLMN